MRNNSDLNIRYFILGGFLSVLPLLITFQVMRIQIDKEWTSKLLEDLQNWPWEVREVQIPRGKILDRKGRLLAGNQIVYEIGINLEFVKNPETIAQTLSALLDVDYMDVYTIASMEYDPKEAVYAPIKKDVPEEVAAKLEILIDQMNAAAIDSKSKNPPSLEGVSVKPQLGRTYPEQSSASNILGFVNSQGRGFFGVEESYNELLSGLPRRVSNPLHPLKVEQRTVLPKGADLVLTIDISVQMAMERILDKALKDSGAVSGTLVVIDPKTGEILAMASTPRINLNEYWKFEEIIKGEMPFNRAIGVAYEPGSVYKTLTMATALDLGVVEPDTEFIDRGVIEYGGYPIYNWNRGAWGPQTMLGCMQNSLNVCLAWVAIQTGADDFYRYMQAFGIGRLTGVDLAGEATGRLKTPGDGDWFDVDLATNAFGQGVAVTPLQMAVAVSALANEGKMMVPHIVRSVVAEHYQQDTPILLYGTPIKPETAATLSEMLAQSLEKESSDALVTGYRVAGKTGTAEIPTEFGYSSSATNASFVGWGPVDDPQFVVYVWLERPLSSPWGSIVAAPVFREAVEELVVLLNIPPDDIRHKLLNQ